MQKDEPIISHSIVTSRSLVNILCDTMGSLRQAGYKMFAPRMEIGRLNATSLENVPTPPIASQNAHIADKLFIQQLFGASRDSMKELAVCITLR